MTSSPPRVILFDIDGTILRGGGAGRRAMEAALSKVFGSTGSPAYRYDGKTDVQIVRELMRLEGHADDHIDTRLDDLLELYLDGLRRELAQAEGKAHLCPGIPELLDALEAHDEAVLGLLTGNLAAGAAAKLTAVGLDIGRFKVGAFGSDHEHRPELPAVAQRRAREILGHDLPGQSFIVIGDTPADIHCGRGIGARAIGVATGHYSVEQLAEHQPVAVFQDLSDTQAVLDVIFA